MRDLLAERLLAQVMGWTPTNVAKERPLLQALASYKYDDYQQFSPGMRFIESLAYWLGQFSSAAEKTVAYEFVLKNLIFYSTAEMNHFVAMAYPNNIRPLLLKKAAAELKIDEWRVGTVASSKVFKQIQRRCLFLGLSDGARTDLLRRDNPELSHEQVLLTYDVPSDRADGLLRDLKKELHDLPADQMVFNTAVLIDDFSASGISYLRKDKDGKYHGKIEKFYDSLSGEHMAKMVDRKNLEVILLLYVATEKAANYLQEIITEFCKSKSYKVPSISVVHTVGSEICLKRGGASPFCALLEKYYSVDLEDEHTEKGGADIKYGYAECGLPLVLSHNTPNNSVYLLWAEKEGLRLRALFPRVSRHK